jgi:hypothetical protein
MMEQLNTAISRCQTLLELLEVLLRFESQPNQAGEFQAWRNSRDTSEELSNWETKSMELLESLSSSLLPEEVSSIQTFILDASPDTPIVIPVITLNRAIESKLASNLIPLLESQLMSNGPSLTLSAGQLFPVGNPSRDKLQSWYGVKSNSSLGLSTNPRSLDPLPGILPSFGIAPQANGSPGLKLDLTHCRDDLPLPQDRALRIGVGVFNLNETELLPSEEPDENATTFFGIGPRDEAEQLRRMLLVLDAATKHEVDILVYSELSVTEEIIEKLLEASNDRFYPSVFVAGSYHCSVAKRNISLGRIRGRDSHLKHSKMERFIWKPNGRRLEEDIERGQTLRIHHWKDGSFAIMICKDAITDRGQTCLTAARPSILLLPSYTSTVSDFQFTALQGIRTTQASMILANGPVPKKGRVVGLVGLPVRDETDTYLFPMAEMPQSQPVPTLFVLEAGQKNFEAMRV